ncbi:MAG TPA: hypothetical protein VNJ01_17880 [Bacteriovoracaceae bacterium]|nr:hypothetical protein [Bacteriovoracaceae bacterium]
MNTKHTLAVLFTLSFSLFAQASRRPAALDELVDYVIQAPDQGEAGTCLYISSTGSMEILLNKKYGLKNQRLGDRFDLSEMYLNFQKDWTKTEHRTVDAVLKFNWRKAIHESTLPYNYNEDEVWDKPPGFASLSKMTVPQVATTRLFVKGKDKWSTNVLVTSDVEKIKQALWDHKSPVLVNYNDDGFWHSINIVGYDDRVDGTCYEVTQKECQKTKGAFYVRDHFGVAIELRDSDWFRAKGNAASVIRFK